MLALFAMLAVLAPACRAEKLSSDALAQANAKGSVRVLVMLNDDPVPAGKLDRARRQLQVSQRVDGVLGRLAENNLPDASPRIYRRFIFVPAFAIEANVAVLARLEGDPDVRRIDIDAPGSGSAIAPDEASVLNNVSPLQAMGLDGTGMKVAVIDSGLDTDHVDLQPRLVAQQCFCSGGGGCCANGQATQSGAGAAEDGHGHGTNVTGIIVGQGIVAPRGAVPAVELVAVRVLDNNNSFCCASDVIAAMDWVAANHPDVDAVNMSVGTSALHAGNCDSSNTAMAAALSNLTALGAVVVASAGNQGNSDKMSAPACLLNAVGVGATWDFTGPASPFLGCTETREPKKPACFSNRSSTTDIYGAGAFVTSTGRNGATSTFGGTSMASPMVAACAIALKQAAPASTVAQRMEAMTLAPTTVTDVVSGRSFPFLDCVDAVQLLTAALPPVLSLADATVVEGNGGARIAGFVASLSKPAPAPGVSFTLATANARGPGNAAVSGQDYASVPAAMVTIPAGQTTATFNVKVFGDRKREADEVFWVVISGVNNAAAPRDHALGRILDDDALAND